MKIDSKSWHYRLYVTMSQINAHWASEISYMDYPLHGRTIGLCQYMRMILIWGPLAILSNLFTLSVVLFSIFLLPAAINGIVGFVWVFGILLISVGIYFTFHLGNQYLTTKKEETQSQLITQHPDYVKPEPNKTFGTLIKDYIKSTKTKVCPVMEVQDD